MKLTAQEIYDKLINDDKILELKGQIKFRLGDVNIIIKQRDVVGNIIQEWLQGWFDHRKIKYALSENTQMPPDFFLDPKNKEKDLLEVKAFNRLCTPAFDIADFRAFEEEIINKPYMLHVDYLIFGYDMSDKGIVTIKDLWLKKVWEITRSSEQWPLNLQVKQGVVHKIRPGVWFRDRQDKMPMFHCLEDFISAIEETMYKNNKTHNEAPSWKQNFLKSYRKYYGKTLNIPHWNEIASKYQLIE